MSDTNAESKPIFEAQNSSNRSNFFWLLACLIGYGVLEVFLLPQIPLTYQESINIQTGRLIGQGHQPYQEVFSLESPLFVRLMGAVGDWPLGEVKVIFVAFGLLLLLTTTALAYYLLGSKPALLTMLLLATSVAFLGGGGAVLAILPALSLGTLAMGLLIPYALTGGRGWVTISGLIWGVALLFSNAVISLGGVILLSLALLGRRKGGPVGQAGLLWLLGGLISLGVDLLVIGPADLLTHLTHLATIRDQLPLSPTANLQPVGQFLGLNIVVAILAAYGLAQIYHQADHGLWLVLIWGLISFIWLIFQAAPKAENPLILLPPMAILAGWGANTWLPQLRQSLGNWFNLNPTGWKYRAGFWATLLIGYLFLSRLLLNAFIFQAIDTAGDLAQFQQRPAMIAFIQQQTEPETCLFSDDPSLAVAANRLPPPWLVDTSPVRVKSGLLSEAEVQAGLEAAGCVIALFSRRDYHRHLFEVRDWAKDYFPDEESFKNTRIYYRRQ